MKIRDGRFYSRRMTQIGRQVDYLLRVSKGKKILGYSGDAYAKYWRMVWKLTSEQPIHSLPGFESKNMNTHHITHIVSIRDGFKYNISPEVIGGYYNLRLLSIEEIKSLGHSSDNDALSLLLLA